MQEISLDYIADQYKDYTAHLKWYNEFKKIQSFKILTFVEFVEFNYKGKYHII